MRPVYRKPAIGALICFVAASLRMWSAASEGGSGIDRPAESKEGVDITREEAGPWIRGRDPFRLSPQVSAAGQEDADAEPPRPDFDLTVLAVAGGSPWRAVVQSHSLGITSRVVSVGDSIGPAIVEIISGKGVVLRGPDSTRAVPIVRRGL